MRLFLIALMLPLTYSLEVPALHASFIKSKFENTSIPAEKLNALENAVKGTPSASKQLQLIKGFIQKQLGNPKIKSECTKVASELEKQLKTANSVLRQAETQFKPLIGEHFTSTQSQLTNVYNSEGSLTRALPKLMIYISQESAQLHGKQETTSVLKSLLAWEYERAPQIREMNEYFSE